MVLSSFAQSSFIEEGVGADRVIPICLGVQTRRFRASAETIAARYRRIASGRPLEVLTVGSFTARKGGFDLVSIAAALAPDVKFQFVGDLSGELNALRKSRSGCIRFHTRVPESNWPRSTKQPTFLCFLRLKMVPLRFLTKQQRPDCRS